MQRGQGCVPLNVVHGASWGKAKVHGAAAGGRPMAPFEFGPLLIIVLVVLILFGAAAIPKLARSLGQAKGEFTKAKREFEAEALRTEAAEAPGASEEQVRKTARELGIDEAGKPLDEVKRLIQQKLA
jgi:sec-independent protein translocase protein TatA